MLWWARDNQISLGPPWIGFLAFRRMLNRIWIWRIWRLGVTLSSLSHLSAHSSARTQGFPAEHHCTETNNHWWITSPVIHRSVLCWQGIHRIMFSDKIFWRNNMYCIQLLIRWLGWGAGNRKTFIQTRDSSDDKSVFSLKHLLLHKQYFSEAALFYADMLDYLRHPLQGVRFGWVYPQHVETEVLAQTLYILLSIVRSELPFTLTDYLRRRRESKHLSFSLWSHCLPWISPYSVVVLWNLLQHHFAQNTYCLGKIGLLRVSCSLHQFCFYRVELRDSEEIEGWKNFPSRQWHKQIVWVSVCVTLCTKWIDLLKALFLSSVFQWEAIRVTHSSLWKKCPSMGKNKCTKQSSVSVRKGEFTKCILTESLVLKSLYRDQLWGERRTEIFKSTNQPKCKCSFSYLQLSRPHKSYVESIFFLYPGNRKHTCTDICHHSATDS